jgi:hypothetical protein
MGQCSFLTSNEGSGMSLGLNKPVIQSTCAG